MNSPARTSPYKTPTFDYLGLSPKIRKSKLRDESSSGSDSSADSHSYFTTFGTVNMRPIEEPDLEDLDETLVYAFQDGQAVWVRTEDDDWVRGQISGKKTRIARTRVTDGRFFPVAYGAGRKYFSPLNGNVKPDTPRVRQLLREGGYL